MAPNASNKGFKQDKQWNWHNFFVCLSVGFIGQLAFGYPSSIIGVTLAQPAFLEYMGLLTLVDGKPALSATADSLIGATSGVFQVCTREKREIERANGRARKLTSPTA